MCEENRYKVIKAGVRDTCLLGYRVCSPHTMQGDNVVGADVARAGIEGSNTLEGGYITRPKKIKKIEVDDHSQRAVSTALWCNFLVFSLKFGVWISTSSHVMLSEVVHSVADFANQALLLYGLNSSKRAPDALHPCHNCSWSSKFMDFTGASLAVAVHAVRKGAAAEGMTV
ncbi:hypothetical protein L1987_49750 [Smallanthus sonchifolius]|uniref:Uncharacterized protein n=1 Tax=Smallanthus sonchifolius TaxID=185202 RepID=A0ACB9FWM2_9ASTR|nr:hypothetical protein L1987_49750 [Smallanthus sonchifolius]